MLRRVECLSLLGLQYVADREGALREMARVLAPGARGVVIVWREFDRSSGFAALAEALGRTIGSDAEAVMRAPFGLSDVGELSALLSGAGLHDCAVRAETGTVRFASATSFVRSQIGGSPRAPIAAAAPASAREQLLRELERALAPVTEPGSLWFPMPGLIGGTASSPRAAWNCTAPITAGHYFHATGHRGVGTCGRSTRGYRRPGAPAPGAGTRSCSCGPPGSPTRRRSAA